jgi:hypothetical protein
VSSQPFFFFDYENSHSSTGQVIVEDRILGLENHIETLIRSDFTIEYFFLIVYPQNKVTFLLNKS